MSHREEVDKVMTNEGECRECRGTGKCARCQGSGRAEVGLFRKRIGGCPMCNASGKCRRCGGSGRSHEPPQAMEGTIWEIMHAQAEAAMAKDASIRNREQALRDRGVDPQSPEFEHLRIKHSVAGGKSPPPEPVTSAGGGKEPLWEVMAMLAAKFKAWEGYLAELEEIADKRGL
ncbi:MAG: hypothetical protein AB1665_03050 [Candidatus Thermoplasmatota archaeon]